VFSAFLLDPNIHNNQALEIDQKYVFKTSVHNKVSLYIFHLTYFCT